MAQLSLKQLDAHLKKQLSPIYLISGDEPLLIQEARENICAAAQLKGFTEKEVCHIDSGFHFDTLIQSIQNQSFFSEKKIIDIRNPSAKFDTAITTFFQSYFLQPTDDRIIIFSSDKLTAPQQKSACVELIKKHGVFLPVWPIPLNELPRWIIERGNHYHLKLGVEVARLLANFCEGNLLGAAQAIEKLTLLYPHAEITREPLIEVLSDHARFNIFDLSQSIMQGDAKKITRIIARLEQTGEEPALVLWAICRKLRESSGSIKNNQLKRGLQFAAHVDEIMKGGKTGDVWQALLQLSLLLCGHHLIPEN
ncbi:MAG: DNA polymerase III subunit delta [Gammaproteobacteria bacterium RIFCSPHIGHO2_12_FULL_40_19]|nr:MAG: DNA polymerase III subunit delta [Gammaproteobacteria bacterium RIFCSPHIGHO2_12_FULL_40_19]